MAAPIQELKNYKEWAKQIHYWRTHLDVFIEDYFKIRLKDVQRVEARAFGNCQTLYFVQSRGFGKTWLTAICCIAMAVLYPGSQIAVISGTAEQAKLILKKIESYFSRNEIVFNEIEMLNSKKPVQVQQNKARCGFKNGSVIESYSIGTFRGNRAKILVIDEAPEVKEDDLNAVAKPVLNYTREVCVQNNFKDYESKIVSITSACLKNNYFYDAFVKTLRRMAAGDTKAFACALDYRSAARVGISPMSFFEGERRDLPAEKFMMEYGSVFLGAEEGSLFPYELTERCRVLSDVETAMPNKSKAEYVMSVDLATSSRKTADNAVITIFKLIEREDGMYVKRVVYIRSYHGKRLDSLATEVRKLLVRFPNIIKIVFDHRGLGDAFPQFMSQPWTDPETKKEYPPLVLDTERSIIAGAIPLLHPFIASMSMNQALISATTIALERGMLELPMQSRKLIDGHVAMNDDDASEVERKFTQEEKAIFVEADALQVEMGNIVSKPTQSGNVVYDTAKTTQHKDRYSSLAMGIQYVSMLEESRMKKRANARSAPCIGVVTVF